LALRPFRCAASPANSAENFEIEEPLRNARAADAAAIDILRKQGTERPGSSPAAHGAFEGIFACAAATWSAVFGDKFETEPAWPRFLSSARDAVRQDRRPGLGNLRTKFISALLRPSRHVSSGPKPTGLRYCMDALRWCSIAPRLGDLIPRLSPLQKLPARQCAPAFDRAFFYSLIWLCFIVWPGACDILLR